MGIDRLPNNQLGGILILIFCRIPDIKKRRKYNHKFLNGGGEGLVAHHTHLVQIPAIVLFLGRVRLWCIPGESVHIIG